MEWLGLVFGFTTLVFVHELGHYALAKWNGVRVKVFSIGMGPYLISFTRGETVYAFSLVPIGGYVKMLGQEDMNPNVDSTKDPHDYRNKRPGQRAAILAAGAVFNLIFALMAFSCCYYLGVTFTSPRVGEVPLESPAGKAVMLAPDKGKVPAPLMKGDTIISVDGVPMRSFMDLALHVAGSGTGRELQFVVERDGKELATPLIVTTEYNKELGAATSGLTPFQKPAPYRLGFAGDYEGGPKEHAYVLIANQPEPGTAAFKAGLQAGDRLVSMDGKPIYAGEAFRSSVKDAKGTEQTLVISRNGKEQSLKISAILHESGNYLLGISMQQPIAEVDPRSEAYAAGLRAGHFLVGFKDENSKNRVALTFVRHFQPDAKPETIYLPRETACDSPLVYTIYTEDRHEVKFDTFVEALSAAWYDLVRHSTSVFTVIRGLLTNQVSPKALSSPLGIGQVLLKVSTEDNFMYYLWFLAFLSVNLGMLQFVPIPLLDGWHLVMVGVEKLKGSPVTPKVQEAFQYVGLVIILGLLLMALSNDIVRIFLT